MRLLSIIFLIVLSKDGFSCEKSPRNADEVYKCALENHPSLQPLKFREAEFEARVMTASQAPSLDIEAKTGISRQSEFELEVLQPIDLGGRIEAQKAYAQAENRLLATNDHFILVEILRSVAENITKLRQIEQSLAIVREAQASTGKITKLLRAKLVLTPEDRTTLGLMNMYDYSLSQRANLAEGEREALRALLENSASVSLAKISWEKEFSRKKWPKLSSSKETVSLDVRTAQADLTLAQAEIRQVLAGASPVLSVGPTLKHDYDQKRLTWGVMVNLTLPPSNIKRGEQALAQVHAQQAEAKIKAATELAMGKLESLKRSYEKAVASLAGAPKISTIKEVIIGVERQFSRGLIQPNALIETYRSSLETLEVIHQTELEAVRTYFEHETALGNFPKDLI